MSLIDRAATFKGGIVEHGISETNTGGYPQFVASFVATHIWDPDDQEWRDVAEVEGGCGTEINCYLVLYGSKGDTLNVKQVAAATGWDGVSYSELDQMDLSETVVQFRVEDHLYDGKESLQVKWIDAEDAIPGGAVRKLEPDKLKELDAKFAGLRGKPKPKAAKPKAAKPKSPGKTKPKAAKAEAPVQPRGQETAVPAVPPTPEPPAAGEHVVAECTKKEAWADICLNKTADVSDEDVAKHWVAEVTKVIEQTGHREEDFNDTDWGVVRERVTDKVCVF